MSIIVADNALAHKQNSRTHLRFLAAAHDKSPHWLAGVLVQHPCAPGQFCQSISAG